MKKVLLAFLFLFSSSTPYAGGPYAGFNPTYPPPVGTAAIGNTVTSGTAGSVLFLGAAGVFAQDNTNFFFDDSNDRLGIGTTAPSYPIHARSATGTYQLALEDPTQGSVSSMGMAFLIGGSVNGSIIFDNTLSGTAPIGSSGLRFNSSGTDMMTLQNARGVVISTQVTSSLSSLYIATHTVIGATFVVTPPAAQTVASGNTITADGCGTIKRITNPSAVTTNTTNTFTAPATSNAGCFMYVVNTGTSTITLDNNALFVSAGAADVAMTANDAVSVVSDGSKWYQISALLAN